MKPDQYPPITDEKLDELDGWYSQFTSNSFEMKFCDADYWAMRQRLKVADAEIADLKAQACKDMYQAGEIAGGLMKKLDAKDAEIEVLRDQLGSLEHAYKARFDARWEKLKAWLQDMGECPLSDMPYPFEIQEKMKDLEGGNDALDKPPGNL
jgi:hypothetical protein